MYNAGRQTDARGISVFGARRRSSRLARVAPNPASLAVMALVVGMIAADTCAQEAKQKRLERVFGDAVRLDAAMVAKVKAAKAGEELYIDSNGDGKNDEVWFIDTSPRHTKQAQPVLVRAIDEDGDLERDKGPDLDSDLYVADWQADGVVDVVLDYQDNDGDNDLDEMAFYYWLPQHHYFGKKALGVWWGCDDGDDNLLWYDINYTYYQNLCQYRCHFSGDESFVAFGLREGGSEWISGFENPFLFYDPDGDECSEVVLRIEGLGNQVRAIRYSFDIDNDAVGRRTHDYDFSITAVAKEGEPVQLPADGVTSTKLRGIPTQRWLDRHRAQGFVTQARWYRAVLTWDEMNANTEGNVEGDPNERWEGIIAHKSEHFPQVGGPACSALNKRNEVSLAPVSPLRLYYDPCDRRLHFIGANEGWLHVDYDFDGRADALYTWVDENKDGMFDRRQLDLDADGRVEFDWAISGAGRCELDLDFEKLNSFYNPMLAEVLEDSQRFIDEAAKCLKSAGREVDAVREYFVNDLEAWMPATRLGHRIRSTPAGARLYVDLIRDRLLLALKREAGQHPKWAEIERRYAAGEYREAVRLLDGLPRTAAGADPRRFGRYVGRIPIRIDNSGGPQRIDWPVTVPLNDVMANAPGFDPDNVAVVAPERWIEWRAIPHQVDELDSGAGRELSFITDVPAASAVTCFIYYSPADNATRTMPRKTATAEDWIPPNIGWESNRCAYRAYWGQFDFFGKKADCLIYDSIGAQSYHDEIKWGIDALLVGKTAGLGGLTLYVGDRAYPVQNPAGEGNVKFAKRVVVKGPVRSGVEITAANVIPDEPGVTVRMRCLIYADRQETEIRASLIGGPAGSQPGARPIALAPGFIKLDREQVFEDPAAGCFGAWGYQSPTIGEIGMGLIAEPARFAGVMELSEERRCRLRTAAGETLRYWLIGDWRRGRQHPVAPTVANWRKELTALAVGLNNEPRITVGRPEQLR